MKVTQLVLSIHITDSNGVLKNQPDILVGKLPVGYQTHLPTIVNEDQTWIILHDANYTHYSLYAKNVAISKKETGNVSFNLLLPFNQKLDEGHRVVDVLDKVKELWKKVVSIRINQKYSLATKSFEEYISSINLCKRELTFPVMKGNTPAAHCICNKGQLGALLNFTRYPLLSTVAWLELGHECPTTINLPVLQKKDKPADNTMFSSHTNKDDIKHQETQKPETVKTETDQAPVGEEYEIWLNGRLQLKGPLPATTPIQSNGGLNSEDITYDPVSVTLQELIEAEGNKLTFGQSTAELNLKTRRIILTIPPIKVYYKLEFVLQGDEEGIKKLKQNLETGVNSLLIDGTDVSKEISNPDAQIAPSKTKGRVQYTGILQGFKITERIDREIKDKKAVLTLSITKKSEEPATRKPISNQSGTTKKSNQKSLVTTTDSPHNQQREDYEEKLTPKPNKKWLRFVIGFSIGLLIGSLIGFGLGYALHASEDTPSEELTQQEEKYKQLDANYEDLKTKYRELEDKNKELEKQRQQQTIEVKQKEPENNGQVDPLTAIQSRNDFQEFMNKVKNNAVWSEIESHEVFKALKKHAQTYSWKVQYFIKPESLFGGSTKGLGQKPNNDQSKKIREWKKQRPQVNNLKDIKKEVDKLVIELKRLN